MPAFAGSSADEFATGRLKTQDAFAKARPVPMANIASDECHACPAVHSVILGIKASTDAFSTTVVCKSSTMNISDIRVGVDVGPLAPPRTGIGNYELSLLDALQSRPDGPPMFGFAKMGWTQVNARYLEDISSTVGKHDHGSWLDRVARFTRHSRHSALARHLYSSVRRKAFELTVESKALSIFHAFGFIPPGSTGTIPCIPVVYDLSFVRMPETHPPLRVRMLDDLGQQLQSAAVVHTISEFSAREIAEVFGVSKSRIKIIYPGVHPIFMEPFSTMVDEPPAQYKLRRDGYFLAVSTLEPRKNLRTLIMAYSRLTPQQRDRMPLCIVGAPGWGALEIPESCKVLERAGSVRFLGFVPNDHLQSLYFNARAVLYPSVYEGFGMPIIEALACGTQVVCSSAASMPEAAGSAATLVHPLDVDLWCQELQRAADVSSCSSEERGKRRLHASQFTWSRAAAQTMEIYSEVGG